MLKDNPKLQKGVALYLSAVIMAIMLAIALGISAIFLGQVKVMRGLGYSVIAFYAADAGVERILTIRDAPLDITLTSLSNGATYQISVISGGSCGVLNFCIKSIGNYKETNRAIEVTY